MAQQACLGQCHREDGPVILWLTHIGMLLQPLIVLTGRGKPCVGLVVSLLTDVGKGGSPCCVHFHFEERRVAVEALSVKQDGRLITLI